MGIAALRVCGGRYEGIIEEMKIYDRRLPDAGGRLCQNRRPSGRPSSLTVYPVVGFMYPTGKK